MTIILAILVGMAVYAALIQWLGQGFVLALAATATVLVLIGVVSDALRYAEDRATARRRMQSMRDNDALNRILGHRR